MAVGDEGTRLSSQISNIAPDLQRTLDDNFSRLGKPLECRLDNLEKLIVTSLQSLRNEEAQGSHGKDGSEGTAIRLERQKHAAKSPRSVQGEALFGIQCYCSPSKTGSHQARCFYSVRSVKKTQITGQIIFFNLIFRWKIEAEYSLRAFPRDFQVYPNFTIRVMNPNSPAWKIIHKTFSLRRNLSDHFREKCHESLRLLHQCFAEKAAWPTDVDETGQNIFHVWPSGT